MKVGYFTTFLTMGASLAACTIMPQPLNHATTPHANTPQADSLPSSLIGAKAQLASVRADQATPQTLTFPNLVPPQVVEQAASLPSVPASQTQTLDFVTGSPAAGQIKIPANGSFQLITVAGTSFQILDNDATDGTAKVQFSGSAFDLYVRPEAISTTPVSCPSPAPTTATGTQLLDQLDQAILTKANELNSAGKSQCVYLPTSQRQNGNCNSTASGLQCSGALNKTISAASCPEIVLYGGSLNLNHALVNTKIFAAMSNNLALCEKEWVIKCQLSA